MALAGVEGPCPRCGEITQAPARENGIAPGGGARFFAKPPPRRDIPPPLAPVAENRPSLSPVRPIPLVVETAPVAAALVVQPVVPITPPLRPIPLPQSVVEPLPPPPANVVEPPAASAPQKPERHLRLPHLHVRERGIFEDSTDGRGHQLDVHPPAPALRRHGWRRWMDIGIVSVFTGLLLATVAALRFTVPVEHRPAPGLPENLNQLVDRESENQRMRAQEAGEVACAAVNRYLGAASELAAASHLLPPPEGMAPPAFPPFVAPPAEWVPALTKRIPLTDRYLVTVQPKDASGPLFIVEQTENGPRLHAGAITQQSAGLFEKFTSSLGEGEATLYVEICPLEGERDYRAQRPDLAPFQLLDVRDAFPAAERKHGIFCLKPDSDAARLFARRAHDPAWRRALIQVRWQQHREAGPWVELVKFLPTPWSGDPPAAAPPATTASTSP